MDTALMIDDVVLLKDSESESEWIIDGIENDTITIRCLSNYKDVRHVPNSTVSLYPY